MIDTHVHISPNEEIKIEGLKWVVLSASSFEDSLTNLELAKNNNSLKAAVGVHPMEKVANIDEVINKLDILLTENKNIVAVGECGLDDSQPNDHLYQEILFRGQIVLSIKHKKPLIIHSRKAMDKTLDILKSYKNLRGVIHCYSGGKKRIKEVLDLPGEWYFGIDGNLTYEPGLVEVVKNIPKDRLLLETDSPELTPIPHRGEKNYPEYVKFIYRKVAEIWGIGFVETEKIIDKNAERSFEV